MDVRKWIVSISELVLCFNDIIRKSNRNQMNEEEKKKIKAKKKKDRDKNNIELKLKLTHVRTSSVNVVQRIFVFQQSYKQGVILFICLSYIFCFIFIFSVSFRTFRWFSFDYTHWILCMCESEIDELKFKKKTKHIYINNINRFFSSVSLRLDLFECVILTTAFCLLWNKAICNYCTYHGLQMYHRMSCTHSLTHNHSAYAWILDYFWIYHDNTKWNCKRLQVAVRFFIGFNSILDTNNNIVPHTPLEPM